MHDLTWSKEEKRVARAAFDLAWARESAAIVADVRAAAGQMRGPDDVWRLGEMIDRRRRQVDERYNYRGSMRLFVLADLIRAGWLKPEELQGPDEEKLRRVAMMTERRET